MSENKPLYKEIVNYLKREIQNQSFKPGDRLPTEKELAERFGVSRITSIKALEELKNDGLIYRIRGSGSYVANFEKNLDKNINNNLNDGIDHNKVVSIVLPFDVTNGGIINAVTGAAKELNEKGYMLSIHCCNQDINEEKKLLSSLYKKVAGIIHYPISDKENLEIMNYLYLNNYPIITIDKYYESIPISYVVSDNFRGEYEAVQYLIAKGHKRIAFVSDRKIEEATSARNRYFGYCKALIENKIMIDDMIVKNGILGVENDHADTEQLYKKAIEELLKQGVTAICAINDYIASTIIKITLEMGVAIPKDLSIIGFDNLDFVKYLSVPLTTIQQNFYKIGKSAAQMLLESIESGEHEYFKNVVPTKLIERESCSKVPEKDNMSLA